MAARRNHGTAAPPCCPTPATPAAGGRGGGGAWRGSVRYVWEGVRTDPDLGPNFAAWRHLPPTPPSLAPFPDALDGRLAGVLARRGIDRLYSHPAPALEAAP